MKNKRHDYVHQFSSSFFSSSNDTIWQAEMTSGNGRRSATRENDDYIHICKSRPSFDYGHVGAI